MVPELTRSSIAEMITGIADCARRRGYLLRLFVNNKNIRDNDALEKEHELWQDVVASRYEVSPCISWETRKWPLKPL